MAEPAAAVPRPVEEPRARLAARLFGLGLIPIAVFCAVFAFTRAILGVDNEAQAWTFTAALAASMAATFAIARVAASAAVGEVEAVGELIHHVAVGVENPEIPALTPPLEGLKDEVLAFAKESRAQQSRLQEKLDTSRQQIFFLTSHDGLTGLANRKTLEEKLETLLVLAKKHGSTHALLHVDVDLFHRFNDAFGHLAGDDLLRRLAPVLRSCLREGDVLGRMGGDEFGVLLENVNADYAKDTATRIRDAVQSWQFEWDGRAFQVGVSVGVVSISRLTPSLAAAFSEGDTACFTAKEQGRNRVFAFHGAEATQSMRKTSRGWLKRINDALAEGAFTLLYQPILPLGETPPDAVPRVEALLRMSDTGGELAMPMSFIPVAERYDLMRLVDRWVVERGFADFRRLARLKGTLAPAEFSINLSGHTLSSAEFEPFLREKLTQYEIPPRCLYFEITETAAIANVERARSLIGTLRGMGVRFFLDDFGNGLSSFNYLKHFPVDGIKIDGLFVKGMAKSPLDYVLVESIHRIAGGLGLQAVAECVETGEIAAGLAKIGVTHGQGFHLAAPRPLESVFEGA